MRNLLKEWWRVITTYPQQKIEADSRSYDEYWEARGRTEVQVSAWQKERSDIALSLFGGSRDDQLTVLDIGCGDGAVLQYLKSRRPNMHGIGVDFSEPVLQRVAAAGFEIKKLDVSEPAALELPNADYAILFEVIEHVRDSEVLVSRALEKVNKGVCVSIPNTGFFTNRLRLIGGKFPMQWVVHPNEHLRFWTLRDAHWWLKALGWGEHATVRTYQGVPVLKNLIPSWFAAGIVIYIKK